uniref:Uncharacterized protein n=1 Tax=Rhizophora mucronata TaxID=61149 RepID=A0A2P2M7E0_RHIMU
MFWSSNLSHPFFLLSVSLYIYVYVHHSASKKETNGREGGKENSILIFFLFFFFCSSKGANTVRSWEAIHRENNRPLYTLDIYFLGGLFLDSWDSWS